MFDSAIRDKLGDSTTFPKNNTKNDDPDMNIDLIEQEPALLSER
jgi:hypothetical protein